MPGTSTSFTDPRPGLEERVEHERLTIDALFETSPMAIFLLDEQGRVLRLNQAAEEMFGWSAAETIGEEPPFVPAEMRPEYEENLRQVLRGAPLMGKEAQRRRRDGSMIDVQIWASVHPGAEGLQIASFLADITTRKRSEAALRRSELELRQSENEVRRVADHINSVREVEQARIAREIHDVLGQELTVLKMDAVWLEKRLREAVATRELLDKAEEMREAVDRTLATVRRVALELRPVVLDDLGLEAAIEWHVDEFEKRTGVRCFFQSWEESAAGRSLGSDAETALFRILQEAMTNIARHADARTVLVNLVRRPSGVSLAIRDDGKGFEREELENRSSLGRLTMCERARACGGEVRIEAASGEGTAVIANIPWEGNT